jgi:hypothetical protein
VSVTCPHGHVSATADYCDECGAPIVVAAMPAVTAELDVVEEADTSTTAAPEPCPLCGTLRSGDDRYCEACGYDFLAPAVRWTAVVRADPERCARAASTGLEPPAAMSERRITLAGDRVRIGRGRHGDAAPEIDLAAATADPGISRTHAVLERAAGGAWTVRDVGSTNGTRIGDASGPLAPDVAVELADGDVIRLGAWTTITLEATGAP